MNLAKSSDDTVPSFFRLRRRVIGKLDTAMSLDHSETVTQWQKNNREHQLRSMIEMAHKEFSLCDLCFVDLLIDNFIATGF